MNETNMDSGSVWTRIAPALYRIRPGFPAAAVAEAQQHWPEVRSAFFAELARAVEMPDRVIAEGTALPLYAVYLAAAQRDRDFAPLILGILRLPVTQIEDLLADDAFFEGCGRCLASVLGDDTTDVEALIADERVGSLIRLAGCNALVIRVRAGDAPAQPLIDFLFGLAQQRVGLARALRAKYGRPLQLFEGDLLFSSAVYRLTQLGAKQYLPTIRQWFSEGLLECDFESVDELDAACPMPDEAREIPEYERYISDLDAEMAGWACYRDPNAIEIDDYLGSADDGTPINRYGEPRHEPVKYGPKPGRNDLCPCGSGKKYKKCCG